MPWFCCLLQVFNGMTLVDLQAFITEEETSLQKETEMEGGPVLGQWVGCRGHGVRAEQCEEHGKEVSLLWLFLHLFKTTLTL